MSAFFQKNKFWILASTIVLLFIVSRFLFLGARPAHHDEGMLSYFAYQLSSQGSYTYTPQIHGPILFYLTALAFKITSSASAIRLATAFCGVLLGLTALLFFRKESKKTALLIALLILVSPILTYYARFLVHTSIVILFNFCTILFLRIFFRRFMPIDLFLSAIFLALAFGTSETSFILVAIVGAFIPIYYLANKTSFLDKWLGFKKFCRENIFDVLSSVLIFIIFYLLIYSVGLTNLESLKISLPNPFDEYYGLGFWLKQHPVRLGGQPWFYYLLLSLVYELPALLAFIYLAPRVAKNRKPFELFLLWWTIGSYIGFSWAGEKFPWLFLPSLSALTLSAGYFIGMYWKDLARVAKGILIVLILWTAFVSVRLNFFGSVNTIELPVYVQTPVSFAELESKMLSTCLEEGKDCILIDPKITWPMAWDLIDKGRLEQFSEASDITKSKFALLSPDEASTKIFDQGWKRESIQLREWWVPSPCRKLSCAEQYINYFFSRKIWSPKGGYNIILFSKE